MPQFLMTVQFTPESTRSLIQDPEDRIAYAERATEALGGHMKAGGVMVGGSSANEAFCLLEMPDVTTVTALTRMLHASGAVTDIVIRRVLSSEEDMQALQKAQEFQRQYKSPGR